MKFIAYDVEFDAEKQRDVVVKSDSTMVPSNKATPIPTRGMSIQVGKDMWINIMVSEWGSVRLSDKPMYDGAVTAEQVKKHRYDLKCGHCGFEKIDSNKIHTCPKCFWAPLLSVVKETIV